MGRRLFPESCRIALRCPVPWRDTHKAGGRAVVGNSHRRDKEICGAAGKGGLQLVQKQKLVVLTLRDAAIPRLPAEFEGSVLRFLSSLSGFSPVEILGKTLGLPHPFVSW